MAFTVCGHQYPLVLEKLKGADATTATIKDGDLDYGRYALLENAVRNAVVSNDDAVTSALLDGSREVIALIDASL